MRHLVARALALVLVLFSVAANADAPFDDLVKKLATGPDFRVRMQAALELGKTQLSQARGPLEAALDDESAAVRAAAAAALKALNDDRALPALRRHKNDASGSVRSQIKATIAALEGAHEGDDASETRVLIRMGKVKNATGASGLLGSELTATSKKKLGALPGVKMIEEGESHGGAPVLMITGRLNQLRTHRIGTTIVYSAKVEYVLHKMPQQSIAATVSGSASRRASAAESRDQSRVAEILRSVVIAAIESAMERAPEALVAAVK